jgi:hypothetical protein
MWGNGICPETCKLYGDSVIMAEDQQPGDDPNALKKVALTSVKAGGVPVELVAAFLDACQNEPKFKK